MKKVSIILSKFSRPRTFLAGFLVFLGLLLTIFFSLRTIHAFQRLPPFPSRPPKPESTDVEEIRSWMNLKFISKVYGVPQDYLLNYSELPSTSKNIRLSLSDLNDEFNLGVSSIGELEIITRVKAAITDFHRNLLSPEDKAIRSSMSIQYISVQFKVPASHIFTQLGIPKSGNEYKTLDELSENQIYQGSWEELSTKIQKIVEDYQGN